MFFLLSCEHLAAHTRLLGLLYRVSSKYIYVLFVEADKRELFFFPVTSVLACHFWHIRFRYAVDSSYDWYHYVGFYKSGDNLQLRNTKSK